MYATLSYDVNAGAKPVEDLRKAVYDLFTERDTCDLLADTFICRVKHTADYLQLVKQLKAVAKQYPDQFYFVLTLHSARAPLHSNASPSCDVDDIIE